MFTNKIINHDITSSQRYVISGHSLYNFTFIGFSFKCHLKLIHKNTMQKLPYKII